VANTQRAQCDALTLLLAAAGRGNSEDGQHWLNPSAGQLYRSMKRKDKAIQEEDALSVAAVHEMCGWKIEKHVAVCLLHNAAHWSVQGHHGHMERNHGV
jgi:bisphosphoglycerate-independent phosphoglycerate mutase (AlkP superfamily)